MDFHDEIRVGQHTYGVKARGEPASQDQPASVAVEFAGADADGRVVAEGNLLIAVDGLGDAGAFLTRTLDGLAALHAPWSNGRGRSRPRPPNAGRPWTDADGELLRERWLSALGESAARLAGELAEELGRTRAAVRAQLPRLGCDPDVPGRPLGQA
ncbi:hypothetical protein SAMN02982929_05824 [Saccharopolyspora kobensis]|uniref:Uncharacterized protein n=1 Tax=Saccharopolyspora kobensis TaxID=146035 RepID=A0A1H6E6K7_9PSEU|nr:hypothetical protein [Saccharopolyspora kobensis]SEG93438.1 hypothetical protein SAMN02982929_05824 [Saccharopolyspora kobensis]SFD45266.1 hypothetical protein SAMN05216506_104354 [Saccharopolyspora kobensis]